MPSTVTPPSGMAVATCPRAARADGVDCRGLSAEEAELMLEFARLCAAPSQASSDTPSAAPQPYAACSRAQPCLGGVHKERRSFLPPEIMVSEDTEAAGLR